MLRALLSRFRSAAIRRRSEDLAGSIAEYEDALAASQRRARSLLQPNVRIEIGKAGRARVFVNDAPMAGVVGVELIQPMKEREVDGWTHHEKDGSPIWNIKVNSRCVNVLATEVDHAGSR